LKNPLSHNSNNISAHIVPTSQEYKSITDGNEIPVNIVTTLPEYKAMADKFASKYFEGINNREREFLQYYICIRAQLSSQKNYIEAHVIQNIDFIKRVMAGMASDHELRWIEEENEYQHDFIKKFTQHAMMLLDKEQGRDFVIHRLDAMHYLYKGGYNVKENCYTDVKKSWIAECRRIAPVIKFIRDKKSTPRERIQLIWKRLCTDMTTSMNLTTEFKSEYDVLSKLSEYSEDYPTILISKIKNSLAASNSRKNNKELNQFNVQLEIGTTERIETIANHLNIRKRDVIEILVNSEMAMQICIDAIRRKAECDLKERLQNLSQIANISNQLP